MEHSTPDPSLEFLTSFAAQRQRMLGHAARVLTQSPETWTPDAEPDGATHPLSAMLLASLEELKVAEEELLRQHEVFQATRADISGERDRFRMLFENAPTALLLTDPVGSIHEVNRAAATLIGRDVYYLERKPLAALVPAEERAAFRHALGRIAIARGTRDWRFTIQRYRDMPIQVRAGVSIVADPRFGSALYWHLDPVHARAE